MNRFWINLGYVLVVVLPVLFVCRAILDFRHPEWWGDWRHNPNVYLPLGAAGLAAVALWAWVNHRDAAKRR